MCKLVLGGHRILNIQLKLVLDLHFLINFIPNRTSIGIIWFEKKLIPTFKVPILRFQRPNIKILMASMRLVYTLH
jgi:hypothetical protein